MANRDFAWYHLCKGLYAAAAESDGDEDLSRRGHAEAKLRLMSMSDEELWELAELTSSFLERPTELSYQETKRAIEQHRATACEWINDLKIDWEPTRGEKMPDRILVIEGETSWGKELVSALTRAGFSVACVPDYPEALLKLHEFKPDLVIVDEILPGRAGTEVCSQLRSAFGVPVFVLSEDPGGKATMRALEAGADSYLRKLSHPELVTRVRTVLRRCKG